jgi:hypothetical protein
MIHLLCPPAVVWQDGPPDLPGIWWVDCGPTCGRHTRFRVVGWNGPRTTARWLDERGGVAKPARGGWPQGWRVAPALVGVEVRQ